MKKYSENTHGTAMSKNETTTHSSPSNDARIKLQASTFFIHQIRSLWLMLAFICWALCAWAQQDSIFNVEDLGFSFDYPQVNLNQGDTFSVRFTLGQPNKLVQNLREVEIALDLSNDADLLAPMDLKVSNSWLLDDANIGTVTTTDMVRKQVQFKGFRTDQRVRSGTGEVFRVILRSKVDNTSSDDLILAAGGTGIVLIDNLAKRASTPALDAQRATYAPDLESVRCYPNPVTAQLYLDLGEVCYRSIQLFNAEGQVLQEILSGRNGLQTFDLSTLTSGIYVVRIHLKTGEVISRKIIKR